MKAQLVERAFLLLPNVLDVVSGLGQSPFGTLLWEYGQDRREAPHVTSDGGNFNSSQNRISQVVFSQNPNLCGRHI